MGRGELRARFSEARLVDWDGEIVCQLPLQMQDYRVRYAARGMDEGHTADTILEGEEVVDSYSLWFWPASVAPDRILRQASETAQYWHDWAQNL